MYVCVYVCVIVYAAARFADSMTAVATTVTSYEHFIHRERNLKLK